MKRAHLHPSVRRTAAAGAAAALLFSVAYPSAQPLAPGASGAASQVGPSLMGSADDELSPHLYLGPKGDVYRLWLRAGDTQRGGSAVLLAVAKPDNNGETVLDVRASERGVSYRDPFLAISPSNQLAVLYRQKTNQTATKHIYLARSDDGGKNWTHSSIPANAASRAFEPEAVW